MTPRTCFRCFTYVPRASRCGNCGSVAFVHGQPFPDLREITVPFTFGRSKKQARWLDEALHFDPIRRPGRVVSRGRAIE